MTPTERVIVQRAWQAARRAGRDPIQDLDGRELLFTNQRYHEVRANMCYELALELESMSIAAVLAAYGANQSTPLDAQRALVKVIRGIAREEETCAKAKP